MRILPLLIALAACDEKKSVDEYLVKSATKNVAELKQILASPEKKPIDWGMVTRCADMVNIAEIEKLRKPLADELRQLCTKDVPLAMITAETAKAEAEAGKKTEFSIPCHSPTFGYAQDKMIEAGTIDLAKDVIARFNAACPDRK